MKEKVHMKETISVGRRMVQPCERCGGVLMVKDNKVICVSCGAVHERYNGKWAYVGEGR